MKKVPFFRQKYPDQTIAVILKDIENILRSGQLILHERTRNFESAFAREIGTKHAVSLNSCTTALMICLEYYNKRKKNVLLPSATFITTANSVLFTGTKPVFVDNERGRLWVDFDDIKKKAGSDVGGLILVHLLGFMSDKIEEIREFCRSNGFFLIEDAAHALGSSLRERKAGSLGDAGCFSFYATKHVSSGGSGGMIATDDDGLAVFARKKRLFGKNRDTGKIELFGNDWFLDEVRAAIGNAHLSFLKENISLRGRAAKTYNKAFRNFENIDIFEPANGSSPSFYQYAVLLRNGVDRNALINKMNEKYGVEVKPIYSPCHKEKIYRELPFCRNILLPNAEDILKRTLALPLFPGISEEDLEYVIFALKQEVG